LRKHKRTTEKLAVKSGLTLCRGSEPVGTGRFWTEALRRISGFDGRLGVGMRTHDREATFSCAFVLLLRLAEVVLHWPPAIAWHYHRRDLDALER
jgi:hypothetical protein